MAASSFVRKSKPARALPRGTRPATQHGQLLTSTGISSLDYLLGLHLGHACCSPVAGGGLVVGTVLLIGAQTHPPAPSLTLTLFLHAHAHRERDTHTHNCFHLHLMLFVQQLAAGRVCPSVLIDCWQRRTRKEHMQTSCCDIFWRRALLSSILF